jgi:hypothetical protein
LATALLGRDVSDFITEQRAAGKSWQAIAIRLRDLTGGEAGVTVSDETVRRWAA